MILTGSRIDNDRMRDLLGHAAIAEVTNVWLARRRLLRGLAGHRRDILVCTENSDSEVIESASDRA